MSRAKLWPLALALVPLASLACANLLGFERLEPADDAGAIPPADATSGDTFVRPPPPPLPAQCPNEGVPPGPPNEVDDPSIDQSFASAFSYVFLGAPGPGFNLDGVCTSDRASSSCELSALTLTDEERWRDFAAPVTDGGPDSGDAQAEASSIGDASMVDADAAADAVAVVDAGAEPAAKPDAAPNYGPGSGGDNAAGPLIKVVGPAGIFAPAVVNADLREGKFGIGLVVQGYNGKQNDRSVTVFFLPLTGLRVPQSGKPSFTEADDWYIDQRFSLGEGTSIFSSKQAYVRDGVLYAFFPRAAVRVPAGSVPPPILFDLGDVVLSAKIERSDAGSQGAYLSEGVFGGRWARTPLLSALGTIRQTGVPACADQQAWPVVIDQVCRSLDLAPTASLDFGSKGGPTYPVPCDAVSVYSLFRGYPVVPPVLRREGPVDQPATECTDAAAFRCPCEPGANCPP